MSHHILVVEDEPDINKTVSYNIANEGLKPLSALNLTEAESYISSNNISLKLSVLFSDAFLIARSIFSFGILADLAFWIIALNLEFEDGSGPDSFTAIIISLPILVNVLAIFDHLFIFLAFLNSNALPIIYINGVFTTSNSVKLFLIFKYISFREILFSMYARPIPFFRTGENVPEVTTPIRFSDCLLYTSDAADD